MFYLIKNWRIDDLFEMLKFFNSKILENKS